MTIAENTDDIAPLSEVPEAVREALGNALLNRAKVIAQRIVERVQDATRNTLCEASILQDETEEEPPLTCK